MSDQIVATFRLDEADFAAAMRDAGEQMQRRRSKRTFVLFMLGCFVTVVAVMILVELGLGFDIQGSHFVAFALGVLACFAIVIVNTRLAMRDTAALSMAEDEARGDVTAAFSADGVRWESGVGHTVTKWIGISEVMEAAGGTVLRTGAVLHPIPDASLPLPGDAFRAQLRAWKDAL